MATRAATFNIDNNLLQAAKDKESDSIRKRVDKRVIKIVKNINQTLQQNHYFKIIPFINNQYDLDVIKQEMRNKAVEKLQNWHGARSKKEVMSQQECNKKIRDYWNREKAKCLGTVIFCPILCRLYKHIVENNHVSPQKRIFLFNFVFDELLKEKIAFKKSMARPIILNGSFSLSNPNKFRDFCSKFIEIFGNEHVEWKPVKTKKSVKTADGKTVTQYQPDENRAETNHKAFSQCLKDIHVQISQNENTSVIYSNIGVFSRWIQEVTDLVVLTTEFTETANNESFECCDECGNNSAQCATSQIFNVCNINNIGNNHNHNHHYSPNTHVQLMHNANNIGNVNHNNYSPPNNVMQLIPPDLKHTNNFEEEKCSDNYLNDYTVYNNDNESEQTNDMQLISNNYDDFNHDNNVSEFGDSFDNQLTAPIQDDASESLLFPDHTQINVQHRVPNNFPNFRTWDNNVQHQPYGYTNFYEPPQVINPNLVTNRYNHHGQYNYHGQYSPFNHRVTYNYDHGPYNYGPHRGQSYHQSDYRHNPMSNVERRQYQ